ncbi:MAG: dehydrogenase, partial [Bacteroidetes bacterium]|nr:dehydrogenase [Bacteroidota bacterium]
GEVPDGFYTTEIGKANVLRTGSDLTIITYGYGVHWATKTLDMNPEISADLIDLRSLKPLDTVTIFESVKKTGKAIILHEDTITGGIGGELSAVITRECFEYLDAPVFRCGSLDTPIPFAGELEKNFLPEERFIKTLLDLDSY